MHHDVKQLKQEPEGGEGSKQQTRCIWQSRVTCCICTLSFIAFTLSLLLPPLLPLTFLWRHLDAPQVHLNVAAALLVESIRGGQVVPQLGQHLGCKGVQGRKNTK